MKSEADQTRGEGRGGGRDLVSRRARWRLLAVAIGSGALACVHPQLDLSRVTRIEVADVSPGSGEARELSGDRLRAALAGMKCHEGAVLWKGGVPAVLVFSAGQAVRADGFSFYGHFLRVNAHQWCELTEQGWAEVWR